MPNALSVALALLLAIFHSMSGDLFFTVEVPGGGIITAA